MSITSVIRKQPRYLADEPGGITMLGLFIGLTCLILGGLAIDVANAIAVRTQLQVAADTAAHAALYTRVEHSASVEEARQKALDIVQEAFPAVVQGQLIEADDIEFGHYDTATTEFTEDNSSFEAARVITKRTRDRGNPVSTFLLKLVGFPTWDIQRRAVFIAYDDPCLRDGWVAEGVVDAQSNNDFYDGFCVHSNEYVSLNQNNYWQPGVVVSMPNKADLDIPASGFAKNDGLEEALRSGYINLRILRHMDEIFDNIANKNSEYYRSYLVNDTMWDVTAGKLSTSDFKVGRINRIDCGSLASNDDMKLPLSVRYAELDMYQLLPYAHLLAKGGNGNGNGNGNSDTTTSSGSITIDASSDTLKDLAIYTDCQIKFSNNSALENVVIYDTNTDDKSITSSQGLRLGADDDCDPDGGVQIMTKGGFEVAAKLEIYGSQVIAEGPIQFAAQGDGVEGGSFISGSTIDGTSNTTMSACPASGVSQNFSVKSFRMAW